MEMLANFAYYRYINKNGGGSGSMAFLFVGMSERHTICIGSDPLVLL